MNKSETIEPTQVKSLPWIGRMQKAKRWLKTENTEQSLVAIEASSLSLPPLNGTLLSNVIQQLRRWVGADDLTQLPLGSRSPWGDHSAVHHCWQRAFLVGSMPPLLSSAAGAMPPVMTWRLEQAAICDCNSDGGVTVD